MEKSLLIQNLRNTPKLRIIDFFLENRSDYSKKEIIENIGISKSTFYKVWDDLLRLGILKPTRKYGTAQLYTFDRTSPMIKRFMVLDSELGKQALKSV